MSVIITILCLWVGISVLLYTFHKSIGILSSIMYYRIFNCFIDWYRVEYLLNANQCNWNGYFKTGTARSFLDEYYFMQNVMVDIAIKVSGSESDENIWDVLSRANLNQTQITTIKSINEWLRFHQTHLWDYSRNEDRRTKEFKYLGK